MLSALKPLKVLILADTSTASNAGRELDPTKGYCASVDNRSTSEWWPTGGLQANTHV